MPAKPNIISDRENKSSVREAYRGIVRYIYANRLQPQDRLPPHTQLQKELGMGNDTISEAMAAMVSDGVLERRRRVGTTVCDLSRASQLAWTIGLTQHEHQGFGYAGILDYHLRKLLALRGCRDCTFFRPVPPSDRPHRLEDFHGLAEAVEAGTIDAVITSEALETDEPVLICHLSANSESKLGARLDEAAFLHIACGALVLRGAKRLAWGRMRPKGPYSRKHEEASRHCLTRFNREGLRVEPIEYTRVSIEGGREIADACLAMPAGERPDGFILMDDYVTMGLADRLKDQSDYQPHLASLTNRQAPLLFGMPVIRLEQDIEALARISVDMVMQQLVDPTAKPKVVPYPFHLITEDDV